MADTTFLAWPFFEDSHRSFAREVESWARENLHSSEKEGQEDKLCREYVRSLAEASLLKHSVGNVKDQKHKLDVRSICLARETLARYSGLADFAFAMQGLGSGPLSLFGSPELQQRYLPQVASGKTIAAFALSESEAGSDVAALACEAKSDGNTYVINGRKTWISNAGIADFYVVFARTGEAPGAKGLSAFVVDADTPGFSVPERIAITSPHPLGSLQFENCRIPKSQLIGKPGEGFKIAMGTLDVFRSTVGAAALGFARRALEEAIAHVNSRQLFGQKLFDFQMTQDKIATMATEIDASALLIYRAAWLKDSGAARVTREASMAKYYATEAAQRVIDASIQLFGGLGVVSGHIVEQLYRDIRPLRIYEGTSEIQKIVIANQTLKASGAAGA